jgi:dolichol-phosphate mannosyltransferase
MIYVLVPFYNEEDNLSKLISSLHDFFVGRDVHYVFSDDGSSDKSIEILKELLKDDTVEIISDGKNYGPGHAFDVGFKWIIEHSQNDDDAVVTVEADSTSDLGILNTMITLNQLGYDLVLASVYAQGGGFSKTSFFRKLISSIANLMFRFVFDLKVLTLSSFYRVYKVSLLKTIQSKYENIIEEHGFICMLEILLKSVKVDAKMVEIPMMLQSDNRVGKSKLKVFKTTMAYLKFLIKSKRKLK